MVVLQLSYQGEILQACVTWKYYTYHTRVRYYRLVLLGSIILIIPELDIVGLCYLVVLHLSYKGKTLQACVTW